jgi:hypothetical protein
MENRFFIIEVYEPSGTRTLEKNLAAVARRYVDCILSYDAMLRLAEEIKTEQDHLLRENKRLKPVDIRIDLEGSTDWPLLYFYIGQASVHFRLVKGEII